MSRYYYECPQCCGREGGCAWCNHTGRVTSDRLREVQRESRQMNDDRDWANERNRCSGAHFE